MDAPDAAAAVLGAVTALETSPPPCGVTSASLPRRRSDEGIGLDAPPELPEAVSELIDRVYDAQDAALRRRRRAGWGLDETRAQVSGRGS